MLDYLLAASEIDKLEAEISDLTKRVEELERLVAMLEQIKNGRN